MFQFGVLVHNLLSVSSGCPGSFGISILCFASSGAALAAEDGNVDVSTSGDGTLFGSPVLGWRFTKGRAVEMGRARLLERLGIFFWGP